MNEWMNACQSCTWLIFYCTEPNSQTRVTWETESRIWGWQIFIFVCQSGFHRTVVATLSENLLQTQNLHFNKMPGQFVCIVQFEL